MSLEQVIGVLGQIATWVTVFFVFLTLREMEKQRKATQKPELIIPKVFVHGYFSNWSELAIPEEWRNKKMKADEISMYTLADITIYNIGFGAAKNLKLKWDFDTEKIMNDVKDYCYQNSIPIVVSIEKDFLKREINKKGAMTRIEAYSVQEHEYIMPASVTSSGLQSHLPLTYLNLLSVLIYMMNHGANKKSSQSVQPTPIEIPPLRLAINYEDIGGNKYNKEYDVKFTICLMRITQEKTDVSDGEELVQGMFEFTEKS
jgi:hypothetical protein